MAITESDTQTQAPHYRGQADREKRLVALSSVLAAVFLTTMKLVVGLMTGSLGILAEAAHSGLDLAAAAMTFFAVRVSGRPADQRHTYGHGKVENLSALFETLLLLLTCVWIIYEAIQRLFFKHVAVEASVWAFVIMVVSIGVDATRSRALARVAKKYESQALEADALHFSTDIWSSSVVIGGLLLVRLADRFGIEWLTKADAAAAIGVAVIVIYVSWQLGRRTVAGLLDEIPAEMRDEVIRAVKVPGVLNVGRVRLRRSGPETFADVTLTVSRETTFERAHEIAVGAETAVREILPGADVVVHVDPARPEQEELPDTVRLLAGRLGMNAHDIRVHDVLGRRSLELHLEVSSSLRLDEAHRQATALEDALHQALPGIDQVVTHMEPDGEAPAAGPDMPASETQIRQALAALAREAGLDCHPHNITVHREAGELAVSLHCVMDPDVPIADAHALAEQVESALRARVPDLGRVIVHVEPPEPPEGNG